MARDVEVILQLKIMGIYMMDWKFIDWKYLDKKKQWVHAHVHRYYNVSYSYVTWRHVYDT